MKENRPDPEKILKSIQEEEKESHIGKLKIYLGYAPGVGKTHSMLEDAWNNRSAGLDVIIGIIETHNRKEVESLIRDFEIIPRQTVEYHGQKLLEFDIDAVLRRNPAIVLIDEMAHTNIPGLRHAKRWRDIKEILDRGIDVYTTLNVQHIESLNDIVSQIIHTRVKETIPDSMIAVSSRIELVDIPPEDLLKRLYEGKVYFPTQAEMAKKHFFLKGNLIALRELALRVMADRVSKQVLSYRQKLGIKYVWPTKEKLLVCVSDKPSSTKLIRIAGRLANHLQAEWMAVYVDRPHVNISDEQKNEVVKNLRLAEKLGAATHVLYGANIADEVMRFAREQNITEIIVYKHIRPRWKEFFFQSIADDILRKSEEIDVYIVNSQYKENPPVKKALIKKLPINIYLLTISAIVLVTIISLVLFPFLYPPALFMIYLLGIILIAGLGRTIPAVIASVLSVIVFNFFFIRPYYQFHVTNFHYVFTLLAMLVVTLIISNRTISHQRQTEIARLREKYASSLQVLSHALASTRGVDKLLMAAVDYIAGVFNSDVMAFLLENNQLIMKAKNSNERKELNDKELSIVAWVYDLGQIAGLGTDTLPSSEAIYIPLLASEGAIGVLRVRPHKIKQLFSPQQIQLLEACAHQIANAIEVDRSYYQ